MSYITLNELASFNLDDLRAVERDLAIIVADAGLPDCPIIYTSDAFLEHSGYDRHEIVGRNCRFMQGELTEADAVAAFRDAVTNREPLDVVITNYRKDGAIFKNHVLMQPIKGKGDAARLFVAVQRVVEN